MKERTTGHQPTPDSMPRERGFPVHSLDRAVNPVRHKPIYPKWLPQKTGRTCWVCGKIGGAGFTTALRRAGYDVPPGAMAYAHPACMARAAGKVRKNPSSPGLDEAAQKLEEFTDAGIEDR